MNVLDVFGVSTNLIGSYIERTNVDGELKRALNLGKQIIIYGSSKQGKTALLQKQLNTDKTLTIECSPNTRLIDIYSSILRQSNIEIIDGYEESSQTDISSIPSIKAKVKIPFIAEIESGGEMKFDKTEDSKTSYKVINFNLSLAQDILEILKMTSFNKSIILENFHYLNENIQKEFAFDLRTFQDGNIRFIIVGIWRERNRLGQYNRDLQDRMIEVAVEPWIKEDFYKVIEKGATMLNLDFSDVKDNLIKSCFDSIGVLQELCKECCFGAGIKETSSEKIKITNENFSYAAKRKLEDYSNTHIRALESFVTSAKKERKGALPLFIPYYFIKVLLSSDFEQISNGFKRKDIHSEIIKIHHRPDPKKDIRASDMSNFLHTIVKYQIGKSINPPLFDYDMGIQTLKIIDSTLYFFLRESDRAEILENLPLPSDKI